MKTAMEHEDKKGNKYFSHFGPEANHFDLIEKTFKQYGEKGHCDRRYYIHSDEEGVPFGKMLVSLRSGKMLAEIVTYYFMRACMGASKMEHRCS